METVKELRQRVSQINKALETINPDSNEAINLIGERDDLSIKISLLEECEECGHPDGACDCEEEQIRIDNSKENIV